ncbi:MAG: murein L,D-transpeptidase YcbB/YkuD [Myxococcota bacterium]|jgi:murein L,D-transpeptidase YcbB/YkuD
MGLLLFTGGLWAGCGDGEAEPDPASLTATEHGAGGVTGTNAEPEGEGGVQTPKPPPTPVIRRDALVREMGTMFESWAGREAGLVKGYEPGFKTALGKVRWFKKLSGRAYEARSYKPIFSEGTQLTESADALLDAIYAVSVHGISEQPYDIPALKVILDDFSSKALAYQKAMEIGPEGKRMWDFLLTQRKRLPLEESALRAAAEKAGLGDAELPELAQVKTHLAGLFKSRETLNDALRAVDIALTGRYFRYIYDMRFARRAHPFHADKSDGEGVERTMDDIFATFDATKFTDIAPSLAALEPAYADYAATKKGLAFYRELAEHPFIEVNRTIRRKRRGKRGGDVKDLQRRLASEGYYTLGDEEPDGKYSEDVEAAIKDYQELHQIKVTGRVDGATLTSLNTSFADRVKQLELSLQRHRESELHQGEWRFGTTSLRVRINIPAFEAMIYKDGVEARRHRVVVGNNTAEVNHESGKKGRFNQTRMFSAEMSTIVLNPTWKVPKRIKEQELDLRLFDEPDFYEKHNYEVSINADGSESVMQLPGPGNALGLVKFLFPNSHAIYMHDTSKKSLFKRTIRAFSHGCMRTESPLDLARWILVENGHWTDERFDKVLKSRKIYGVALKEKIPVTTDYNTIGVHSSGRMMFLSDIYKYDRDYGRGITPYRHHREHPETNIIN